MYNYEDLFGSKLTFREIEAKMSFFEKFQIS